MSIDNIAEYSGPISVTAIGVVISTAVFVSKYKGAIKYRNERAKDIREIQELCYQPSDKEKLIAAHEKLRYYCYRNGLSKKDETALETLMARVEEKLIPIFKQEAQTSLDGLLDMNIVLSKLSDTYARTIGKKPRFMYDD